MDLATTTEPKSDQQNFDDYAAAPKTVTVSEVKRGTPDQPVEIHLTEYPGRPFKPSKSMRRVLVACWGSDSTAYTGRQMTLYGDPDVKFGGQAVGGIRIAALTHIDKPVTVALTVTRGKRAPFTVQPLTTPKDTTGRDWLTELADIRDDAEAIRALGGQARAGNAAQTVLDVILSAYNDARAAAASPEAAESSPS